MMDGAEEEKTRKNTYRRFIDSCYRMLALNVLIFSLYCSRPPLKMAEVPPTNRLAPRLRSVFPCAGVILPSTSIRMSS